MDISPWSTVFLITFSREEVGREKSSSTPQVANSFGNKGFDKARGSEVQFVLRKKGWGQALLIYSH